MKKVPLTISTEAYDRVRALSDGRVQIDGCDPIFLHLPVEETFFRALRSAEFDVAELSMSSYTLKRSMGTCQYTAIPVFMSRSFRHSGIYVPVDSPLTSPTELKGKLVGVPEYQLTAPVWIRGIMQDEYGVKPTDIRWRTGGVEAPGRHEKIAFAPVPGLDIAPIPVTDTLDQHLLDGHIEALVCPRAPPSYVQGKTRRLIPNLREVETDYYKRTGIFPIMHVVGIRNELCEQYPWLPASLFKAFSQAKDLALTALSEVAALNISLPFLVHEYENSVALMGKDFWSYGVADNRKTLETFLRYHHEQGLSTTRMTPEDMFHPGALEQFII
jgi:4,5-dihydroxyphthalate decarboxylase